MLGCYSRLTAIIAITLVFSIMLVAGRHVLPAWAYAEGFQTQDYTFWSGEGELKALSDYRGKVVLVNFWATWCPPCIKEMPQFAELQQRYGERGFHVIAISQDMGSSPEIVTGKVRDFYAEHELTALPIYVDESGLARKMAGVTGLPVTVIYDREGNERLRVEGVIDWLGEDILAKLNGLLDGSLR